MDIYYRENEHGDNNRSYSGIIILVIATFLVTLLIVASPIFSNSSPKSIFLFCFAPALVFAYAAKVIGKIYWTNAEKRSESRLTDSESTEGLPPHRNALEKALREACITEKGVLDRYLVGFDSQSGSPFWLDNKAICKHACILTEDSSEKSAWLESLMLQQLARGRASGFTVVDAKPNSQTLEKLILMAQVTGRIEDLIIIDSDNPAHYYNFVQGDQTADIKATKIIKSGLQDLNEQGQKDNQNNSQIASEYIYRIIRSFEKLALSWSIRDLSALLSKFSSVYPNFKAILANLGARQSILELEQLAGLQQSLDRNKQSESIDNILAKLSQSLSALSGSRVAEVLCANYSDLILTEAIERGQIIYFKHSSKIDPENAERLYKIFREDFKVSAIEISASRSIILDDPHLVFVDDDSTSTSCAWAELFETLARSEFALIFGLVTEMNSSTELLELNQRVCEKVLAKVGLKLIVDRQGKFSAETLSDWFAKYLRKIQEEEDIEQENRNDTGQEDLFSESENPPVAVSDGFEKIAGSQTTNRRKIAWFAFSDRNISKGRYLSLNLKLPNNWNYRRLIVKPEKNGMDQLGIFRLVNSER